MEGDAVSVEAPSARESRFPARFVCFGPFYVDINTDQLYRSDSLVKLSGKPIKLLLKVIERRNEIVFRDELCRDLWAAEPDATINANLTTTLTKLRKALGDSASEPIYIETIPRLGYSFKAPVQYSHFHLQPLNHNVAVSPLRPMNSALRQVLYWMRCRRLVYSSVVILLITSTVVGSGASLVWVEGIRARSVTGLALVSFLAVAIAAMVFTSARLIFRSRQIWR
jgi:DNA-binding winged helix-turn-helix (wHTH) protein